MIYTNLKRNSLLIRSLYSEPTSLLNEKLVLTNLHHLPQLVQVASNQVEEGKLVKVLGPLVGHLDHLMVALQEGCLT